MSIVDMTVAPGHTLDPMSDGGKSARCLMMTAYLDSASPAGVTTFRSGYANHAGAFCDASTNQKVGFSATSVHTPYCYEEEPEFCSTRYGTEQVPRWRSVRKSDRQTV